MTEIVKSAEDGSLRSNEKPTDQKDEDSIGLSDGRIPDNCLFSSSALNQSCGANQARLHKQPFKEKYGAWTPLYDDKNQYLDVDLGEVVQIGAIATQGRPAYTEDGGWFIESYSLAYGNDGDNYQNLKEYGISKVFEGNKDPETVVRNQLKTAIKCRWVRIKPVTWHTHVALRIELYKSTGNPQNARKKQTNPKQSQKSDRGTRQNTRATKPIPAAQVKDVVNVATRDEGPIRINDTQQISVAVTAKEEVALANEGALNIGDKSGDHMAEVETQNGFSPSANSGIRTRQEGSFEVIETASGEQKSTMQETSNKHEIENGNHSTAQSQMIPVVSVRDQAQVFRSRPAVEKVDSSYRAKMKGASAVATRSDGSKFIGKIKLVKKEEDASLEADGGNEEEVPQKRSADYVAADVVKERLSNYQDVVLRSKENRGSEDLSKRKSMVLEEDLKYRNEMESSVFDRLRQFKETENKSKENFELSKQEEEKRQSLKRDAEKRRSMAQQKEKERMLALLQKQKEEELEQQRKREESEAEQFVEIEAEVGEPEVPAVVNDRLRLFKESEQHEKERQEVIKAEAEKRRQAKEDAERKRQATEQKERERLQELIHQKQREHEEQTKLKKEEENGMQETADDRGGPEEEPVVPSIVNDRIKMFKDGEKAKKEKEEALRIEAQKKRAAEEEAERSRILAEESNRKSFNEIPVTKIDDIVDVEEEEIVVAEENVNVESEIAFDFMEADPAKHDSSEKEPLVYKEDENQNRKEALDLQMRLEGIDTHHDGYDPDHEREMLEEAEKAFRSFAVHQKGGSRQTRSSKTESLIRSFTVDSSSCSGTSEKRHGSNSGSARKSLQKAKSVDGHYVQEAQKHNQEESVNGQVSEMTDEPEDSCVKGLVKDRANIFSKHTPPVSGAKVETSHAQVKEWIAAQPPHATEASENERVLLSSQLEEMEAKTSRLNKEIERLKSADDEEESLALEEDLHVTLLEISKVKRRLLKIQKEHGITKQLARGSSVNSEAQSLPDGEASDNASSSGSRSAQKRINAKLSRECKVPLDDKPLPPVDIGSFNDDGDVVIEGNVLSQIQTYEEESSRQRKQVAEVRKSLSQSRSSLDSLENPPPMGFGGPEFAKDKANLSRECKLQRDNPVPPVDQECFNDDGDCVPEGNVLQQIKMFQKASFTHT